MHQKTVDLQGISTPEGPSQSEFGNSLRSDLMMMREDESPQNGSEATAPRNSGRLAIRHTDIPVGTSVIQQQSKLRSRQMENKAAERGDQESDAETSVPIMRTKHSKWSEPTEETDAFGAALHCRIRRTATAVWQEEPLRLLKYRASHLHYWGWMPLLLPRYVRASVLYNAYIHVQGAILIAWCLVIHLTGLGLDANTTRQFVRLFGSPLMGGLFNLNQFVVFILGFFVALVVNRWFEVKAIYGRIHSLTQDLIINATAFIRCPQGKLFPSCRAARLAERARGQLSRYLNLGHLLVIASADAQSRHFRVGRGLQVLIRKGTDTNGGSGEGGVRDPSGEDAQTPAHDSEGDRRGAACPAKSPGFTKKTSPRDIGMDELYDEGLVTLAEWEVLDKGMRLGLPQHFLPYQWSIRLVDTCLSRGLIQSQHAAQTMQGKLASLIESVANLSSSVNSQIPFPYASLVSLTVHVYLAILSTYFGCMLFGGYPDPQGDADISGGCSPSMIKDGLCQAGDDGYSYESGIHAFTAAWLYVLLYFGNILCQGLLDLHSKTDNLFGKGPSRFPLRAQTTSLINSTQGLLRLASGATHGPGDEIYGEEEVDDDESTPVKKVPRSIRFDDEGSHHL